MSRPRATRTGTGYGLKDFRWVLAQLTASDHAHASLVLTGPFADYRHLRTWADAHGLTPEQYIATRMRPSYDAGGGE